VTADTVHMYTHSRSNGQLGEGHSVTNVSKVKKNVISQEWII